jgi:hypothetical protein
VGVQVIGEVRRAERGEAGLDDDYVAVARGEIVMDGVLRRPVRERAVAGEPVEELVPRRDRRVVLRRERDADARFTVL